jgi:nucleotide-binding universal stress UspA family protein
VPRYRHVLVAFDGSPDAELALDHAIALAQSNRSRLALVSVIPPPPLLAWQAPGGVQGLHDAEQKELEAQLHAAADRVPDDLPLTTRLLDGDPARMTAALLGSVSNHVMHDADVPVIVIHRPHDGPGLAA